MKGGKSGKGDKARRKFLGNGLPNKKPSSSQRLNMIGFGMEWDSQAKRERQKVQPWKGSKEHASILRWGALGGNRRKP